jgi:hypothetical protein
MEECNRAVSRIMNRRRSWRVYRGEARNRRKAVIEMPAQVHRSSARIVLIVVLVVVVAALLIAAAVLYGPGGGSGGGGTGGY